ncbi:MAG: HAD family phosphatase [Actinobacteria bacterium]|nr:HAD family phosphatase [Actinomycetota bacterium]
MSPDAVLIDFGGVLTTSVFVAFEDFCRREGLPAGRVVELLRDDRGARELLVTVEKGEMAISEFERELAPRIAAGVAADGLVDRLFASLRPEPRLVEMVAALRGVEVRTVLVSNSLGPEPYRIVDLQALFETRVISAEEGVRKPSRRIYEIALERAGVGPDGAVFVDDLVQNVEAARRLGIESIHHVDAAETVARLERIFDIELEEPCGARRS